MKCRMLHDTLASASLVERGESNRQKLDFVLDFLSKKWALFVTVILIKFLYDFATVRILTGLWYPSHSGSYDVDLNIAKLLLSYPVFIIFVLLFLNIDIKSSFHRTTLMLLLVLYYLPMHSAFYLLNASVSFFLSLHLYVFAGYACVIVLERIDGNKHIKSEPPMKTEDAPYTAIMLTLSLICLALVVYKIAYNGLQFSLDFASDQVYGQRERYLTDLVLDSGSIKSYVVSAVTNLSATAAPLLILISLIRQKYLFAIVGALAICSYFSLLASKSIVFSLGLVAIVYLSYKFKANSRFQIVIVYGMFILLLISILVPRLYFLIIRRTMYVPAWLNAMYFSFFSDNPKVLWSQDAVPFKWLIPDVYSVSPMTLINNEFFRGEMPSPNTGLFAEAFMHFGIVGLLAYPLLTSLLLRWMSKEYGRIDEYVSIFMALKIGISLTNIPITRVDFIIRYVIFTGILFCVWAFSRAWQERQRGK